MITGPIRPVPAAALCWAVASWLVVVDNAGFWRTLWAARDLSSSRSILAVLTLAAVLWVLFSLILRVLCWRWVGKPLLATVLLVSALAVNFIGNCGVLIRVSLRRQPAPDGSHPGATGRCEVTLLKPVFPCQTTNN